MPDTEPNFGWPVAKGPDPLKQYPATVDNPFKTSLAGLLAAFTDLDTVVGAALSLTTADQIAATIPAANGANPRNHPILFVAVYQVQWSASGGSANITPTLQFRDAADANTLVSRQRAIVLVSPNGHYQGTTLILPYMVPANTSVITRATIRTSAAGVGATTAQAAVHTLDLIKIG